MDEAPGEIEVLREPAVPLAMAELRARHEALLERVTVLERALGKVSEIIDDDWLSREARTGVHPRHEIRRLISDALDA